MLNAKKLKRDLKNSVINEMTEFMNSADLVRMAVLTFSITIIFVKFVNFSAATMFTEIGKVLKPFV